MPDWGFVLAGRTDAKGLAWMKRLSRYPNFIYIPWMPRAEVAGLWKSLDLSLLLYRPYPQNCGAFPVKVLDSFHFGVPCVATRVPKTMDLASLIPLSSVPSDLRGLALEAVAMPESRKQEILRELSAGMDPAHHLDRISTALNA